MPERRKKADPLLKAVGWTVVIGLLALAGLAAGSYFFKWEGFWRGAGQPYATTLAALAAITAAAIALHNGRSQLEELRDQRAQDQSRYEEQREQDQKRYEEQREQDREQREQDRVRWEDQRKREETKGLRARFAEATSQLANDVAAVRLSGAYAMAALANDWRAAGDTSEMLVCFRVLGAYLSSPNPTYWLEEDGKHTPGLDGPVRAAIVTLLSENAQHYQKLQATSRVIGHADLRGVTLTDPIAGADLSTALLQGADFNAVHNFKGARLNFAKLIKANLSFADLRGAQLESADLTDANLWRANLAGVDLNWAELPGADLDAIKYDSKTIWPDLFEPPPSRDD